MTRREKALQKMRRSPGNVRFAEVETLLRSSADAQTSSASEVHCRAEDGKRRASRKTALAATC